MSPETVTTITNGRGYKYLRAIDGSKQGNIAVSRLLMYAWGELESPFFSNDMHEVHHLDLGSYVNIEDNLMALTPKEHREIDDKRANLITPWDRVEMAKAGD